jgi:DNA-binding transcriptional MerR regulator
LRNTINLARCDPDTMMSIGQFSERTGLRPKTLRYYEEVGLLIPDVRLDNGYRQYSEKQEERARFIHSLRQAGVSLADIREFLHVESVRREELLARWRAEAAVKLLSVQVANQFLKGLEPGVKHMHLVHWDKPKTIVWLPVPDYRTGGLDLQAVIAGSFRRFAGEFALAERAVYVRFPDGDEDIPEIGFVPEGKRRVSSGVAETIPQALFATLECQGDMPFSCKPILATIRRFGFQPAGTPLRKYAADEVSGRYTLMIPVVLYD